MKRLNPIIVPLISVATLAGALLALAACGTAPTAAPNGGTPLPVVVDNFAVIADGRIVPRQSVQLSFDRGGRVETVLVAEGSSLAADGLIAQLEVNSDGSDAKILYDGVGLEWGADYSPDGQYISFSTVSASTGHDEVFIMKADGSNILQVTSNGGQSASWISQDSG